jgi:WD40 repeat protein
MLSRLTGPVARIVLLALAVAGAWLGWAYAPPRPLRGWATASREPVGWECRLTPDRTRLACLTHRQHQYNVRMVPEYGPVRLWDLDTGRERLHVVADSKEGYVPVTTQLAPDGSWLLTARPGQAGPEGVRLQLWDTDTGRERWSTFISNGSWVDCPPNHLVAPDGRYIACRRNGTLTTDLLLTDTGQVRKTLENAWPLAFTADSRILAVVHYEVSHPAVVSLWDTETGEPRGRLIGRQLWAGAAAFSPDGRWLAVGLPSFTNATSAMVELWDWRAGTRVAELEFSLTGPRQYSGLKFSPDGSLFVAVSSEGSPLVWDMTQTPPRPVDVAGAAPDRMRGVWSAYPVFAPDGARFISPGPDPGTLALRETAAPERAVVGRRRVEPYNRPEFSPDSRTVAVLQPAAPFLEDWKRAVNWLTQLLNRPPRYAAEARSEVVFFDARTGEVTGQLGGLPAGTRLLGFGPDGRTVWTLTYTPGVLSLAMLPDNGQPWIAPDGTLRVQQWAVPSPRPPAWLLALTALGVLLAAADFRRTCRRRAATVGAGGVV